MLGEFNYGPKGILDLTHKRLFTISSFRRLLENAGFRVTAVKGFGPPIRDLKPDSSLFRLIDWTAAKLADIIPSLFSFSFLLICERPDSISDLTQKTFDSFTSAEIRNKWSELGAENSFLGFPVTDEKVLYDKEARDIGAYNNFENGAIIYLNSENKIIVLPEPVINDISPLNQGHYILSENLIWEDSFDYTGKPDPEKWLHETGGHGWGNKELQYYTNSEQNAYASDGTLKICAIKENFKGSQFTSARLHSKQSFLYGKFRIRAKCPVTRGSWAAIWMLPYDFSGDWPQCGEIDIMEFVGWMPNKIIGTIHTKYHNHLKGTQKSKEYHLKDVSSVFHEYGLDWTPDSITWSVDGEEYYRLTEDDLKNDWPFDKPFYILLNLAVGGNYGGIKGIDYNRWPQIFEIDYVRVYQ